MRTQIDEGEETNSKVGRDTKNYNNQCSESIDSLKSHIRKRDVADFYENILNIDNDNEF